MRIQLMSDLHLEAQPYTLKPSKHADVIVLAGDIGNLRCRDRFQKLLSQCELKPCVYVSGNHEYYGSTMMNADYQLDLMLQKFKNVVRLKNNYAVVDTIGRGPMLFAGGTLWTDFCLPMPFKDGNRSDPGLAARVACQHISDFKHIRDIKPSMMYAEHSECRLAIMNARALNRPMVVVTHFVPHPRSIHPKYANDLCNAYFCSDNEDLMGGPVKAWLHGHTHSPASYEVNGTQVHCNPRGYTAKENPEFSDEFLIEMKP
jgi:predicted phosphodiesterase